MDSIYHIITDVECKILHYGKEVCIAKPKDDSVILLRKGRHKLTFVSTENVNDQYSIMYEVPENDIEDCLEVELLPFRKTRLLKEAEELKQKEELKSAQERRERQERIQELEREARRRREKERINRLKENLEPLSEYLNSPEMRRLRYFMRVGFVPKSISMGSMGLDKLFGYFDEKTQRWCVEPKYLSASYFEYGVAVVSENGIDYQYIDSHFNPIETIPSNYIASDFCLGVGIIIQKYGVSKDRSFRVIDINGKTLFEKTFSSVLTNYLELDCFPFRFAYSSSIVRESLESYNRYNLSISLKNQKLSSSEVLLEWTDQMPKQMSKHPKQVIDDLFGRNSQFDLNNRIILERFLQEHPDDPKSIIIRKALGLS